MPRCFAFFVVLLVTAQAFAIHPPRERERWAAVTIDEFTILGNASDRELREVATRTLRLRDALAVMTNLRVHSPLPTKIYVFADERSFAPYRDAANGRVSENTAGVFLPRSEGNYVVMIAGTRGDPGNASSIVQHELTHHFLGSSIPAVVPLWFSEGLADFYSTFEPDGDTNKVGLPRADHLQLLKEEPLMPFAKLAAIDEKSSEYSGGTRRGVFYAQSWALVHDLMLSSTERRKQVGVYLTLISNGTPASSAFRTAFKMTDADVDRELRRYVKKYAFGYMRLTSADFRNVPAVPAPATLPRADELAYLGDLLVHCNRTTRGDGEAFLREALRLNPKHAGAMASLAFSKLMQGRRAEADALFIKAVDLGVREWMPYAYAADSLVNEHVSPSAEDVAKARALYEKAIALNPDAAQAYAGLGMTYIDGDGDPKAGIAALEKAMQLDPRNLDTVANLALLYLRTGRRADAVKLIDGPLADDAERHLRVHDALLLADATSAIDASPAADMLTPRRDQAQELNRARSFAVSRKFDEALAIVDRLLAEVKDAELLAKLHELRKQLLAAKKKR